VIKYWLGKHKVFGELDPKTYPLRTKDLKYSTKLPWGERNLEVLTKVAQGKGVWDVLGRLGFPPREWVGLPRGDLVGRWRRGLSLNQVAT
jgi:hypothetical protein